MGKCQLRVVKIPMVQWCNVVSVWWWCCWQMLNMFISSSSSSRALAREHYDATELWENLDDDVIVIVDDQEETDQ